MIFRSHGLVEYAGTIAPAWPRQAMAEAGDRAGACARLAGRHVLRADL